jgi:alkanesulfonate monooxygenase SsuD/methylene tetrahydromethanopterin reductase-like flavin-dependent oxidoreductase (luciferase family)
MRVSSSPPRRRCCSSPKARPGRRLRGSGSGGLFLADTDAEAIEQYRPIYEGIAAKMRAKHAGDTRAGKAPSFVTIEEAVAHGPALVGTPERVAAKILDYHRAYRHDVQSVSVFPMLPYAQQQEVLTRFAEEVAPLVRREVSTTLWGAQDPGRAAGFTALDHGQAADRQGARA